MDFLPVGEKARECGEEKVAVQVLPQIVQLQGEIFKELPKL